MKTMQTIDINKKESKTNRRDSNLQIESETRETISRILNEQIQTELPQIAITFDDGPDGYIYSCTSGRFEREGSQSKLFVIGQEAEEHPDLIRRMQKKDT